VSHPADTIYERKEGDDMSNIARRPNGQWRARYRDRQGAEFSKHFSRKLDAQAWLDSVTTAVQTGTYVDPNKGRTSIGTWARQWLAGQAHLKPSTYERYAGIVSAHIEPRWCDVLLTDVSHADVQGWVSALAATKSAATTRKIHRVLSLILSLAVKDGRLARNPALGINLPRVVTREHRYLTHVQVFALADAAAAPADPSKHRRPEERVHDEYRLVVLFLAYTGVRFGEMAALRVRRIDFLRRRAMIAESVTLVRSEQVWGTPKGHERREVPIPRFLIDELAHQVQGKQPDDLVFTGIRGGGALRVQIFRRAAFDRAAQAIRLPGLHPHELRHTAASLAIAEGANVKVVQQMLGHKSATMTLDQYGHLFGDQLDDVADAMDAAVARARTADAGTSELGQLVTLPTAATGRNEP
jgi:integrase